MRRERIKVWVQRFKDLPNLMLQWIDPETSKRKSQSAGTDDETAAETARADLEYELNHGKLAGSSRMTWETFREQFEDEFVAGTRPKTQRNYDSALNAFERHCSPKKLASISSRTLSAFVSALRKRPCRGKIGLKPSTITTMLANVKRAIRWAFEQKMIGTTPEFPEVKVPEKQPQAVPAEVYERICARAAEEGDSQMLAFLACGWLAGLRLNEAMHLEWEETDHAAWVNIAAKRIMIPAAAGKSGKDDWVPLDSALAELLMELPRRGRKVFRFTSRKGRRPLSEGGMSLRVIQLARRAGVKLSMKTLRQGYACRYAGKVPASVLQKLMRHSSIQTTMKYYANVDDAVMEAVLGSCNSLRNIGKESETGKDESIGATVSEETPSALGSANGEARTGT